MNKKDTKPKLGTDPLAWIKDTSQALTNQPSTPAEEQKPLEELLEDYQNINKNRAGRPRTINRKIEKTSQANLNEGWTRATFIVDENLLKDLKDLAYTERKTITDVINEAIEQYTAGKEILRKEAKK